LSPLTERKDITVFPSYAHATNLGLLFLWRNIDKSRQFPFMQKIQITYTCITNLHLKTKDNIAVNPVRQFGVTITQTTQNGAPYVI